MNNKLKRKYKQKKKSCPLCKPHKMHWDDNRSMQDKKQDVNTAQQLENI